MNIPVDACNKVNKQLHSIEHRLSVVLDDVEELKLLLTELKWLREQEDIKE